MKKFQIHYRYRDARNELFDVSEVIEATSLAKARAHGQATAASRAPEYSGKYWFISVQRL